ncbi:MAG TPA: spermidine synthase [Actinoplanes sp.]|nr:spermidine synthase [Actinoplanes sp.]
MDRVDGVCGELALRTDGVDFEVIANGVFLMDTRGGASERLLVEAAADRMPDGGHVLVGGLGVGFSLAAALAHPRVTRVTVVEREPAVVEWARGVLAPFNGNALADARVRCVEADVLDHLLGGSGGHLLAGSGGHLLGGSGGYDAICLDVDNGPDWTVTEGNLGLYDDAGLAAIGRRLAPRGVLAVWSASASPAFAARLRARFDEVEVLTVPAPRGEPDTVFVARQQYACTV